MKEDIKNGTRDIIDGKPCVYYDGYWVRTYEIQADDLAAKRRLIDQLTKRVFHHVEPGINTPGSKLETIRTIYENEKEPARKRIKGAMLAGSLLNRGADILAAIVDLQKAGVSIESNNELLQQCGQCFVEALSLGKNIKLASGEEGLDELWGEPFKVFSLSVEQFYESRYIKIAQTMSDIDKIANTLSSILSKEKSLIRAEKMVMELGEASKRACETMRTDPANFEVWPDFVAAKEAVESFVKFYLKTHELDHDSRVVKTVYLLREGASLIANLATVRVPMPQSTRQFLLKCEYL